MRVTFSKKEVITFLIASLAIALTIAFDDGQETFSFARWFANYIEVYLLTLVAVIIFATVTKYAASRAKSSATFEIWSIGRIGFAVGSHTRTPFYLGVIIPIMLALLSEGKVPFGAAMQYSISTNPVHRIGKQYQKVSEYEQAKVATCAPLVITFLALLCRTANMIIFQRLSTIMITIAVTAMLPLPNLNGMKAFFGSPLLFIFTSASIGITALLIKFVAPPLLFIIAIVFGLINLVLYYNYRFVKGK